MDSWRELQKNSYISWVKKYETEKKKRIEAEEKYEKLVERIKATAVENYYNKLLSEEDQHKMKSPILEWDGDRMDIIGQNGNTGDHYQYELWNYASEERFKKDEDDD
jgi:hypothetical protein